MRIRRRGQTKKSEKWKIRGCSLGLQVVEAGVPYLTITFYGQGFRTKVNLLWQS